MFINNFKRACQAISALRARLALCAFQRRNTVVFTYYPRSLDTIGGTGTVYAFPLDREFLEYNVTICWDGSRQKQVLRMTNKQFSLFYAEFVRT